ncbi:D-amino acid dehydrogenase [Acinetobacter sp. MB5]|uniref:D-amino acid dehydrogenase n=1 Tax=Acinetobacter sp. MB5 TaxID=2069438 RepID=UPI000DCFE80D|nr:D-amino acid dehydrogenase [Acinetobacter sp. MB5]
MPHIAIIGAGITGVTTAYELIKKGFEVTVFEKNLYPAMETSFANGGQLSACNAEVWNQKSTIAKGIKWMSQKDAPLLLNPSFNMHKYAWLLEFLNQIKNYEGNTIETVRLALESRKHMFAIADQEGFDFNLEKKGILHFYHTEQDFGVAKNVNTLLKKGGLERYAVTPEEIKSIEPTLTGDYFGGFFTPDDATGDIHKFTRGLANVCEKRGVKFCFAANVLNIKPALDRVEIQYHQQQTQNMPNEDTITAVFDGVVICGGVNSYYLGEQLGDKVNIYPVKGYSITVNLNDERSVKNAPWVSLLDESAKIVTSRLGADRFRVAGTAEFNGYNKDIRNDRIQPLVDWVNKNFDIATDSVVSWAGLRPMMPNMMPKVQRSKQARVFYNTGHGHLGFTLSAATAVMISHEIQMALAA